MGAAAAATVEEDGQTQAPSAPEFKLVGHAKFVRANPRTDRFPVRAFHHIEFWCSDATNVSFRFSHGLGMPLVSRSDLSTGNSAHASYLLRSGNLQFLFSAPYPSAAAAAGTSPAASIPSFDAARCHRFAETHGLGVRAVAVLVDSAAEAFAASVANGARPAFPPTPLPGAQGAEVAEVELYGDVVLRYISLPADHHQHYSFLPGFEDDHDGAGKDLGLRRLDHAVGNVPELGPVVEYIRRFTGFHEFAEFTAEDVGTAESGLNSVVLANNEETVLLPLNEPVEGKRRSQIQTYLDHNLGPGLQHLALATDDAIATVRGMRARSRAGGFDFMPPPPPTYYHNLRKRAADVLSEEQMAACEELGILVDRDDQGTLLQIFTKPVGDRPTIFLEIIQRIGCMTEDQQGNIYQKGGCGGFGKGNFSELFKSIEEYEKALEAKQQQTKA